MPSARLNALFGITDDTTSLTHLMRAAMGLYVGMAMLCVWGALSRVMTGPALAGGAGLCRDLPLAAC